MIVKLIDQLKKNNRRAQKELYEKYAKMLFLLILRYTNNAEDAGSLTNQSFHKIFINIENFTFTSIGSFEAWMKKIAINESLMELRANRKVLLFEDSQVSLEISPVTADKDLLAEDYYNLVRELPDGYRIIFNLYAIEGYSHKEIGEKLGISESTSRSQLAHARAVLKRKIEQNL